eukprot:gene5738-6029_t
MEGKVDVDFAEVIVIVSITWRSLNDAGREANTRSPRPVTQGCLPEQHEPTPPRKPTPRAPTLSRAPDTVCPKVYVESVAVCPEWSKPTWSKLSIDYFPEQHEPTPPIANRPALNGPNPPGANSQ